MVVLKVKRRGLGTLQ